MIFNKQITASLIILVAPMASAALSIVSTNNAGFNSNTSAIVDNTGTAIAQNTGVISVGTFGSLTDGQIQSLGSAGIISSSFDAVGSTNFNLLDGIFEDTIQNVGDTTRFVGQNIFSVIGNGNTIAGSTQFLIYRHSDVNTTGQFVGLPNLNGAAVVADGNGSTGSLLVGGFNNFTNDFGAGEFAAFNLVTVVPEPSSSALLAIAGVGFVLRRRR
ncbi:PEP-CTERM sorting domain-containing protein [Akkermansiaceae bacterium]|nr:PEP-CTERM sorting domain-containing protein [Akkermansiaceae bacterium]